MGKFVGENAFQFWLDTPSSLRVAGVFRWENGSTRMVFRPGLRLKGYSDYRAVLGKTAMSANGVELGRRLEWTFQTMRAVNVNNWQPRGTNVAPDAAIRITFAQAMHRASVQNTFSITPNVAGTLSWQGLQTVIFTPNAPLATNTRYLVEVGAAARATDGTPLGSPFRWAFTTGVGTTTAAAPMVAGVAAVPTGIGAVQVAFTLSAPAEVEVRVLNIAGRSIATVAPAGTMAAGPKTLLWRPSVRRPKKLRLSPRRKLPARTWPKAKPRSTQSRQRRPKWP